jgi:hypothetical protein
MNHPFDEISESMARSVTRRAALKKFGAGLAGLALARLGLNPAHAISNGQLDGNAHPNVGGVVWLVSPRPGVPAPLVAGSGTLIHPRVYLTAGHGTYLVEGLIEQGIMTLDDLLVSFAPDASDPNTWRAVSGMLTHPAYVDNPTHSGNADAGVLIFKEPVTGISPVPLPPVGFLDVLNAAGELKSGSDRARFTLVGYGVDPGNANNGHLPFPPDGLRRTAQPEFQNLHDQLLYTDQNDSRDLGGSCTGDSGGPLFYVDPVTGQETLVAIVCNVWNNTAHYYRMDTEEAQAFIQSVISMVNAGKL